MSFTQVTVTGTYKLADGSAAEGVVRFTPRAAMHNENVVVAAPVVATLNGSGAFSVSLAATNDPGTLTADGATATYRVDLVLAGQPARNYQIVLDRADTTQNLADIITVTPTLTAADWLTQTQANTLYASFDTALDAIADLTPSNDDVLQLKSGVWANRTIAQLATDLTASAVQPKDADLTAIAALAPAADDIIQRKSGAWTNRTAAQVAADLAAPLSASLQPLDADLTTIAGLTATSDNFLQAKSSAWASRTPTQVAADLVTPLSASLQPLDADLTALGGLGNGVPVRTAGTWGLVTGTPDGTKFLRDDGTWQAPAGGGTYAAENARDDVAAMLAAGTHTNITVTNNDGADSMSLAVSGTIPTARLGSGTASATTFVRGDQTYADHTLLAALVHAVGNSGTSLTIDASSTSGWVKTITLNGNCTVTLTGSTSGRVTTLELYLTQDGTGSRIVTWPASVKWDGGVVPTLSTAAAAVDCIVLRTVNNGTTWLGNMAGKGYA